MDSITALISWQFLLFSLGCFFFTFVVRTIMEYAFPMIMGTKFWNKLALPLMPIFIGTIMAVFAGQFAYPTGLSVFSGRFLFGLVAGGTSTFMYSLVTDMLRNKITQMVASVSQPVVIATAPAPQLPQVQSVVTTTTVSASNSDIKPQG